jgi:hypothetical protein
MTLGRTIEDRLREQYFDLLHEIRRVVEQLEVEVRHSLLPISRRLDKHQRLVVKSRVKECESALVSLLQRSQGTFDEGHPSQYSLTSLNDLAGIRVLAFPRSLLLDSDQALQKRFESWERKIWNNDEQKWLESSRVQSEQPLAYKYAGYCEASATVRGEVQIVSTMIGLFWEVEHSAIYKPIPRLKGIVESQEMKQLTKELYTAIAAFEKGFEALIEAEGPAKQ